MSNVKCKKCDKSSVPRLWHYGGSVFTYMKTQHICPFCGVCMYESGGGISGMGKVILLLLFLFMTIVLLAIFEDWLKFHNFGFLSNLFGSIANIGFMFLILYLLFKFVKRMFTGR